MLTGGNLKLRIVSDRGDTFADATSTTFPDDWAPLERVLLAVGLSEAPPEGLLTPNGGRQHHRPILRPA